MNGQSIQPPGAVYGRCASLGLAVLAPCDVIWSACGLCVCMLIRMFLFCGCLITCFWLWASV